MSNPEGLRIARELIARESREQTGFLNLGRLGLNELPAEIYELTHLRQLNLGSWYFSDNGGRVFSSNCREHNDFSRTTLLLSFPRLESLSFSRARIVELPSMAPLKSLLSLAIDGTRVTDLSPLADLKQLRLLVCDHTRISDLSPVANLKRLKSVDCRYTHVSDLAPLSYLQWLESIHCSSTPVSELSPLANLKRLKGVSCGSMQVNDLSPLAKLEQLQGLCCSYTQISDLAPLAKLKRLRSIDFCAAPVNDLSPLTELKSLESINCSSTQVSTLSPLAKLKRLESVACVNTRVNDLSPLAALTRLKSISCSRTPIGDLAPLAKLENLRFLDCGSTHISDLSPLSNLKELKSVDCQETAISDLSPLAELDGLTSINCNSTHVSDLSPLGCLPALSVLDASHCKLASLPLSLLQKEPTCRIRLYNTQLNGVPPAILSQAEDDNCHRRLRDYFDDLEGGGEPVRDVKVLVIGNGRIGKTQICNRLRNEVFEQSTEPTHGVLVAFSELAMPADSLGARLNLWDFGGQDIYYGTHALFLRSKSIVLLVWSADAENESEYEKHGVKFQNHRLRFWLDYASQNMGNDSAIVIVQNKCDSEKDEAIIPPVEPEALEQLLPYAQIVHYSAKNDLRKRQSMNDALQAAVRHVRSSGPGARIGKKWHQVYRRLQTWIEEDTCRAPDQRRHRTITRSDFRRLCEEVGCDQTSKSLLDYLHSTGIVFYEANLFSDEIILDQSWALSAIYTLFHLEDCYRALQGFGGRFTRSLLDYLTWRKDGHSERDQQRFISMMVSCGICFELRPADPKNGIEAEYLAPDVLPHRAEVSHLLEGKWNDGILPRERIFEFLFLQPGLIRSLICSIGSVAGDSAVYWKYGVWFNDPNTGAQAIVFQEMMGSSDGQIAVHTQGDRALELLDSLTKKIVEQLSRLHIDDYLLEGAPWDADKGRSPDAEDLLIDEFPQAAQPSAVLPKTFDVEAAIEPFSTKKRTHDESAELKRIERWFRPLLDNPDWVFLRLFWYIGYVDRDSLMQGTQIKAQRPLALGLKAIFEAWSITLRTDHKYFNACFEAVESVFNQAPFTIELWQPHDPPHFRTQRHRKSTKEGWNWTSRAWEAWRNLDCFLHDVVNHPDAVRIRLKRAEDWIGQ